MRIHLPAPVPHRDVTNDWAPCAYTGKTLRLATMLAGLGHDVYLYGGSRCDAPCTEHVAVVTDDERGRWFGDTDWNETVFNEFDPAHPAWRTMNARIIAAISERVEPRDIICLTMGSAQAPIAQAFNHVVCEPGVGYAGVVDATHRCYESHAWQHYLWGRDRVDDGRWFDTVIPNAYDPADYQFGGGEGGYLLFMGRLTERKGLEVVRQLARDHWVITAGPGDPLDGIEHLGVLRGEKKAEVLAGARALLSPSVYIEPFGGVAVEAMLSGTPVLASPFGAYPETVVHGMTGYLCHTLGEFRSAAHCLENLDRKTIREWALSRFTLEVCAPRYDRWLDRLATLYDKGWYQ